jgi:hypothetical protein
MMQPRDDFACARQVRSQAGQDRHFDLTPRRFPRGLASLGPKRHHHPVGPHDQGGGCQLGLERLLRGEVPMRHRLQRSLEHVHGPVPGRLHPTPHRPRADHAPTVPAQQPGRRGEWREDRQGTAQPLEFTTGALMRLQAEFLIEGGHLPNDTSLPTAADPPAPPNRPKQAGDLARDKALTLEQGPARRAARPESRATGALGQEQLRER